MAWVLGSNPESPERAPRLGEDDIATGEWRAVQGATFLTCESLLDDESFDLSFDDEPQRLGKTSDGIDDQSSDDTSTSDEERMRVRVGSGKGRAGRGRVKKGGEKVGEKGGGEEGEVVTPTVVKSAAELEAERKERRRNRPPPEGLIVVPTWAVRAKGPFSSAYEYLVGGKSPLVLLPMRGWCLVESVGKDELLVEVGVYAGPGGLEEDWHDMAATEGGESEPRRVAARRYERGGRFASAFFVEESRMMIPDATRRLGEAINELFSFIEEHHATTEVLECESYAEATALLKKYDDKDSGKKALNSVNRLASAKHSRPSSAGGSSTSRGSGSCEPQQNPFAFGSMTKMMAAQDAWRRKHDETERVYGHRREMGTRR